MAKRIKNVLISNMVAPWDGGKRQFLQVQKSYDANQRGEIEQKDAKTYDVLRHIGCSALSVLPTTGNAQQPHRPNTFEDAHQAYKILEQLKGQNKGDESAPFLLIDDDTLKWAVTAVKERIGLFGINTPLVVEVLETHVKDEAEAPPKA